MKSFQIDTSNSNPKRRFLYFDADDNYVLMACEIVEALGIEAPRIAVRQYDRQLKKRVRHGTEFIIRLKEVRAILSNGNIISERWYQPTIWKE